MKGSDKKALFFVPMVVLFMSQNDLFSYQMHMFIDTGATFLRANYDFKHIPTSPVFMSLLLKQSHKHRCP